MALCHLQTNIELSMYNKKPVTPKEFVKALLDRYDIGGFKEDTKMTDAYVVLIRGKRATLRSGKSLWKSKGAAKSALRHHLNSMQYGVDCYVASDELDNHGSPKKNYTLERELIRQTEDEWITKNTIVMPLSKWLEHMEKMKK